MVFCMLVAAWLSFFDSPMERFADAYVGDVNAKSIIQFSDARLKSEMQLEEGRDWRDRPSQYVNMDPEVAARRSGQVNDEFIRRRDANSKYWDDREKSLFRECQERSHEFDMRKRVFVMHNPTPDTVQAEAIAKFKSCNYNLGKLEAKYKDVLYEFLMTYTKDWQRYHIERKRGKTYLRKWY